jgi:anaerobic magnesium-protoporphyrin IX monomethyl ester cyclase
MKILFVYPNIESGSHIHVQPGLAMLSAILKQEGHQTSLIDLSYPMDREEFQSNVMEYNPDLVGFSSTTHQWQFAQRYAGWVRRVSKAPIACGGYHATLVPEDVVADPDFDWAIRGEGEEAFRELADALEHNRSPDEIRNLWGGPNEVKNLMRPPIPDLDILPYLDYDLFDMGAVFRRGAGVLEHVLGKGCPYACTYCCNPQWNAVYKGMGKIVRKYSASRAIDELVFHKERLHPLGFQFYDEIFTINKQWVRDFCDQYKAKIGLPFNVLLRVDMVDGEMMEWLADAGCANVEIGVEAGNEQYRREMLNRKMTNSDIIRVFRKADELGIKTYAFVMIGLPKETPQLLQETVELVREIRPDHVQLSIFHPYPRTPLYDLCVNKGYMTGTVATTYFTDGSVLNQPQLSQEVIRQGKKEIREIVLKNKIEKQQVGIYDFIVHLDQAKKKAGHPEFIQMTVYGDYFNAVVTLNAHPFSSVSYKLMIPENAVLRTALGLNPDVWNKREGDAVRFIISLKYRGKKYELLSKSINPKFNVEDQKWHPVEIPLNEWAGKKVTLSFVTQADPYDNSYSWAGWARPHLAHAGDPKDWYLVDSKV